jgi:hypothetical protein
MAERNAAMLTWAEWLNALHDLSLCCADDGLSETPDRVRELNALLRMAPDEAMIHGLRPLRPVRLEALLDVGACENAVMAMFDHGPGFLLSRSGDGQSLATIALPGAPREKSGSGANPALALIGALALSLSNAEISAQITALHAGLDARPALH